MKFDPTVNSLIAMRHLTKLLRDHAPDSPEVISALAQQRHNLDRAKYSMLGKPFIIKPSQLDTTQPRDVGYGTPEWRDAWYKRESRHRSNISPRPNVLSCWRNLTIMVVGKDVLFNTHNGKDSVRGLIPEYSRREGRRCCFVKSNGMRCMNHNTSGAPVCKYHYRLVESVPRMNDRFLSVIKSDALRNAYEKHLKDPNRKSIESELALMRTMLDSMLHRIEIGTDLNKIPVEMLASVMVMCEKITSTVEKMANMEAKLGMRLSLDQVMAIMYSVVDLVFKTCPNLEQQQLTAIADGIESLPIMKTQSHESIQASAGYGCDISEDEGVKKSTCLDKYTDDGKVEHEHFTVEQAQEHKDIIKSKFDPFTEANHERRKMMDNVLKAAETWQVDPNKVIDTSATVTVEKDKA